MKITVSKIPEEGLPLRFSKDGSWFQYLFPEKDKAAFSLKQADVTCFLKKVRETLHLEGTMEASVDTACSRCLEDTSLPVRSDFKYTLVPGDQKPEKEVELNRDDLDFIYYQEDIVDLDPVIYEQILLQIPIKVLCSESCKGLCSHCGINLNHATCNCHKDFVDERLSVLKQFKLEKK